VLGQANAQELLAKVQVNASRVGPGIDKKLFTTLQSALTTFINNRKWTTDKTEANEKIECTFNIVITEAQSDNTFKATLAVQAARSVYNTSYKSPLINFVDDKLIFKYIEFQSIDFNENRVQGTDALQANLPATLAYYVYIILGLDYDSYALQAGGTFFSKVQNIVNNAPDGNGIEGWKAFDGQRNRYWLAENFNNPRYVLMHEVIYNYYRKALDFFYESEAQAHTELLNCLTLLSNLKKESNNTNMVIQFFMQSRTNEWINLFKKAALTEKTQALALLKEIDVVNANKYTDGFK
jgi:hypothetical protein